MYDETEPFDGKPLHPYPKHEEREKLEEIFPESKLEGKIIRSMIMSANIPAGQGPVGLSELVIDRINRILEQEAVNLRLRGEPEDLPFEARTLFWIRPV